MNRERLQRLVVVLEQVRDNPAQAREFDLTHWSIETRDCGTHCCAVGWAAQDPELRAQGLGLRQNYSAPDISSPTYAGYEGWSAVCPFFGLTRDGADWLFMSDSYDTPATEIQPVIDRISRFLSGSEAP